MVPSPESALERYFRCLLNPKVERRIDLETALVKVLDPVLGPPLDRLADLFREVGADSRRLFFERTQSDRRMDVAIVLRGVDVFLFEHAMQDVITLLQPCLRNRDRAVA